MADEDAEGSDESASSRRKEAWQNYGLAVLFVGVCPLLPILIELWARREITEDSLIITVAVYSITIALASNNRLYFGFLMLASIVESSTYGFVADPVPNARQVVGSVIGIRISSSSANASSDNKFFFIAVLLPFISVLGERLSRHVRNHEEFFEFLKGRGG